MRKFVFALIAFSLFLSPAAAQPHWAVDYAKSKLGFSVQWSGEPFDATFKAWKADIAFDPADLPHSKAVVTIDLGSETSAFPDNDESLKGEQGFAVDKFQTAKFETTKFTHSQGDSYVAEGTLTLHGITKKVNLTFNLIIHDKIAHMVGKASLLRSDFGLAAGAFSGETPIAHAVVVTIDLTATRS